MSETLTNEERESLDLFDKSVVFGLLRPYRPEDKAWRVIRAAIHRLVAENVNPMPDETKVTPNRWEVVSVNVYGETVVEWDSAAAYRDRLDLCVPEYAGAFARRIAHSLGRRTVMVRESRILGGDHA
jgi:hypothetical protein